MLTNGLLVLLQKKKPNLIQLVVILSCNFSSSFMICFQSMWSPNLPARTGVECGLFLKVISLRCQRKSDVSYISLPSLALSGIPSLSVHPPPTSQSQEEVCWWILKAALVPQQLTPLLQEAACQVDGIFAPLLPVTHSRRACWQMLHLCVCFTVLPTVKG